MSYARLGLRLVVLIFALALGAYIMAYATAAGAQSSTSKNFRPDLRRALSRKTRAAKATLAAATRKDGHTPARGDFAAPLARRPHAKTGDAAPQQLQRTATTTTTRPAARKKAASRDAATAAGAALSSPIRPGTSLARILHTSQLGTESVAGSIEQFADSDGDLEADERTTFDTCGGAFDIAVGASGARYEVYSAFDDRGTFDTNDDRSIGVLAVAFDANRNYVRDAPCADAFNTYDLYRNFGLPSAASVVSGTTRAGREFVVVSSSGYYNYSDPGDPENEPTAGVVLFTPNAFGGYDFARTLVAPGSQQLNNANALALLPSGDLLIADFDSNELRVVRDTNADGAPDTLDPVPYYSYQFSNDAPLDIAANSRGVVFSHSVGNSIPLLALYDTNTNGFADAEEVVVEGLSVDDNLILHGLAVDREGTVYVIEDALGASDTAGDGGNGGTPLVDAFPDPSLNGILRDGALYTTADSANTQALTGLAFGTDASLAPVATLTLTNSASLRGNATRDGLGTISGARLTEGRRGGTAAEAARRGVRVTIEGVRAPVHSFADDQINIYVPDSVGTGVRSVVVYVDNNVIAAEDATIANVNPGLFTLNGTGAGDGIALLSSGMRYTRSPFPARFNNQPSVVALFGTGFRRGTPVTASVGGRAAIVEYAGASADFPGLDQINLRLPDNTSGTPNVVLRTADGATSRSDVVIRVN
ncbi:MAG TPA: hypothetical protein VER76_03150 [Pyrinomonadaceae bacterium]|nr:hypothetical protein [Pyrinomonadaceae bacterium]